MRPRARSILVVVLGVTLLLGAATARQLRQGGRAYAAFEAATAAGDPTRAITWLRAAAEAVAPGSPYPPRAYAALASLILYWQLSNRHIDLIRPNSVLDGLRARI